MLRNPSRYRVSACDRHWSPFATTNLGGGHALLQPCQECGYSNLLLINIIASFFNMRLTVELAVSAHIRVDNFVQAGLQLI